MKAILLYTNNLVDIINIPLEGGGFSAESPIRSTIV